ncbi:MAG TPA: hypothetical protein PLG47_03705 [Candidatus Dojkabacteria bacterium]|jgi:hypothetical protein|nr:hypothetical protein [Candidatus Dojkabacteria bacterium]
MNTDFEITENGEQVPSEEFLTAEVFENLSLPEVLPKYQGEGETSFSDKYDQDKIKYLEMLGVEIPEEWKNDRAMLVSTFVVAGLIVVLEGIRRDNRELFEEVIKDKNKQLREARLDEYGYRRRLPNGLLVEDYHKNLGFSANPQKKVSEEELRTIVSYLTEQLSNK